MLISLQGHYYNTQEMYDKYVSDTNWLAQFTYDDAHWSNMFEVMQYGHAALIADATYVDMYINLIMHMHPEDAIYFYYTTELNNRPIFLQIRSQLETFIIECHEAINVS
jgi:hypothetical protein